MMKNRLTRIEYVKTDEDCKLVVRASFLDGSVREIGDIAYFYIKHLKRHGWRATRPDGRHNSVHADRWQAALSLAIWDGVGMPPFPVLSSHRRGVEGLGDI